ncbi:MAG: TonB-dependent receptor [Bacteroides sp.]|nr:TonB-dependent receptor [Bacteroides sp.]
MKKLFFKSKQKLLVAVCLLLCLSANAQQANAPGPSAPQERNVAKRTLTGTVLDAESGEVLIGVNVRIKGTSEGTITDLDGKFSLSVSGRDQIEASYIGYKTQTILVGDLGVVTIWLASDNELLDELVVIGAGTQKKVSVTGAIATVKGATLKAPSSSLTNSLAGKLSGVISMTTSGEPGSSSEFYIRGINTFGGVATPLILLDGIEISTADLNRIPAESIESFSLLKDASATAIYGNRGANGVMLVTTKRGMENTKATINVSLEGSYFKPTRVAEFADGPTFMRTYNEAAQARSLVPLTPKYSDEQILNTELGLNPYVYPNVDWFDLIFKKGNFNQRANINVQGGGSKVTYYMSLQANHDTGLLDAPKYFYDVNINNWDYNFQNNISYKLTSTTKLDMRMMAQIGNRKGPNYTVADMYKSVMQANPVAFPAYFPAEENDRGFIRFGNAETKPGAFGQNPYEYMMSSFKETNFNTLNTSLGLNQDLKFITEGLSLTVLVNFKNWSESSYNRSIQSYFYKVADDSWDPDTDQFETQLLQTGDQFLSQSEISRSSDQTFYFDARLDWKRNFNDHNVTGMLMYMMREYRDTQLPNHNQGYSGRFTYDYANKYLVEFNFGYNGSERLASGHRFELFPAVSAGWVASSEKFWEPLEDYINHLKIRASYGLVGSDSFASGPPHFLYQNSIGINSGYNYWTGLPTNETSKQGPAFWVLAIENAGWEHVKKFDIGVDFSLFNQFNITFDYFRDHRDRILMERGTWPNLLGYWGGKPWSNIGEVINKGVEFSVNWSKQFGKDLWVDLRGNFTYNQNEYKYIDEPDYPYVWQAKTGKPLNTLTGYVAEGLFTSEEEIANWADQPQLGSSNIMPGDIKYRDINGDGKITAEDQVMLSPYNNVPRIQYGFGLSVNYKNFDLGLFFNGSAKRKLMINSGMAPFLAGGGDGITTETLERNLMLWIAKDHWSVDNPNPNAAYPRLGITESDVSNNIQPSSFWVRNGNFLRFKTLEIGYRLPYCRIYFSGDNLAVFSPFKLWDPELEWNAYPLQRTFNLGVQFNF